MGYAETDITPEMPVIMVGFNRTDNVSRGIMDRLMAQEVIHKVEPILKTIDMKDDINVHTYSRYIPLQSKIPSMDEAHKIADEALKYCGIDGQNWLKEVESFHDRGISFLEENLEIQYFCISDWCLCGIPNETMK